MSDLKVNRWTTLVCAAFAIFSILVVIVIKRYIPDTVDTTIIENIFLGLFTSFTVSMVVATIGYWHEKEVIIEKTSNNLKSLYSNMFALSKAIGQTLQKIHTATSLDTLSFKNISGFSQLNVEFLNNIELGLFSPLNKNSQLAQVYIQLSEFQSVVYNIKNISIDLEMMVLQYTYDLLQLENAKQRGLTPNPIDLKNIDAMKNLINIRTAKLHEHTTDRTMQLEKIAEEFFSGKHSKQSWKDIKPNLLLQIEDIVKR